MYSLFSIILYKYIAIVKGFKQVVYYGFDQTMNEQLLMDILCEVEDTGLKVRAISCDMGNQKVKL